MRAVRFLMLALLVSIGLTSHAQPAGAKVSTPHSDKEKLIGAWHLASLGQPGPDGNLNSLAGLKGTLIYTRDGHMSVQLMYPKSASTLSNDYVLNGYEASFGSYDVDEAKHLVTHHVQGSITRSLIGKDLPRMYQLTGDGRLVIKSANPEEHWSVTWEHE